VLLLDKVKLGHWESPFPPEWCSSFPERNRYTDILKARLLSVIPFEISNVANYLYEGTDQEDWNLFRDFPRPVPPFTNAWFEFVVPKKSNSNGRVIDLELAQYFARVGVGVSVESASDQSRFGEMQRLRFVPFVQVHGGRIAVFPHVVVGLSESGEILPLGDKGGVLYFFPEVKDAHDQNFLLSAGQQSSVFVYPVCLALSMLNCRNVTTSERRVPEAILKSHRKKGHPILAPVHRVIEIQPMIRAVQAATGSSAYSPKAASIVRGHFKDYRVGKGLFGKVNGVFWWGQRLSGDVVPISYAMARAGQSLDEKWDVQRKARLA
jgi:hypothetical protein